MSSPRVTCLHVCYTQYEFVLPKLHRKASKSAATASVASVFQVFFPRGRFEFDSSCCPHGLAPWDSIRQAVRLEPPPLAPGTSGETGDMRVVRGWWIKMMYTRKFLTLEDFHILFEILLICLAFLIKFCFPFWKASTGQEASLQPDHLVLLSCTRCAKTRLNYTCGVTIVTSSKFSHVFMICNDEIQHSICFHGCCTKWFHCGLFVVWGGDGRQEEGNRSPTPRELQRGHDVASEKLVRDGILKITELHQKFRSWAKMLNLEALMWTDVVCGTWKAEHEHDP